VYKIWSPQGDKIYVGSTTKQYLSQRMTAHRKDYKKWKNGKGGLTTSFLLFDEYGLENCFIELIEAKACSSKDELKQFEGHYVRTLKCVNKNIPDRTMEEYNKKYYEDHKDKINEHHTEYRENNRDKIKEYRDTNKDKMKEYRETNKDKIKEYREVNKTKRKEYNQANRDKINARRRELRKEKKLSSITN